MKNLLGVGAIVLPIMICAAGVDRSSAQQQEPYTFGAMFPLTGPAAEIGELFEHGLDMAVDGINASGGVAGRMLKPVVVDHKGTAQGGVVAMNQLVNLYHAPFVLSSFASVALASQPIAAQNSVLLINIGGASSNLLDKPWLYNDQVMGAPLDEPLAQYMHDRGLGTATLLTSDDAYGRDNGIAFSKAWTDLGGKILASETFPLAATDFTPQLMKIRATAAQVLYLVVAGDAQGLVTKQARALGIDAVIGAPLTNAAIVGIAGAATEGFLDTGMAVDPNTLDPAAKAFLDAYKNKYGGYPEWPSGTAYEAVQLLTSLVHAVVAAGGDPSSGPALLKALQDHPSFQNYLSGGKVTLLPDHGSIRAIAIRQIKNGEFVTVKIVQP